MKRKTANKALSLLLTLCMVIGLLPGVTLTASAEEAPHDHSSGWKELTNTIVSTRGGFLESGNYYLSEDLTLTKNLTISGQDVTICLNGHVLTGQTTYDSSVIKVQKWESEATLTICDCKTTEHKGYIDAEGLWHKLEAEGAVPANCTECNLTGGVITGGNIGSGNGGAVYIDSGTVTFTGGNIAGNTAGYGGGVYNQGTLNLNGGSIVGNKCSFWGGGVCSVGGTVEMTGGAISYNTTDRGNNGNMGGGVYSDGTFTMSGGTIQCFDWFANLNIGFTFLRCFAGKEIQNINAVMMRLLATTSKDWGLSDVVPYIELDFFNTSILSSPTVPMIPLGRFFLFIRFLMKNARFGLFGLG